jgi:hypothetical protein
VELHFFRHGGLDPAQCDLGAYVRCESVAEVHGWLESLNRGSERIPPLEPPTDRPWQMREAVLWWT